MGRVCKRTLGMDTKPADACGLILNKRNDFAAIMADL